MGWNAEVGGENGQLLMKPPPTEWAGDEAVFSHIEPLEVSPAEPATIYTYQRQNGEMVSGTAEEAGRVCTAMKGMSPESINRILSFAVDSGQVTVSREIPRHTEAEPRTDKTTSQNEARPTRGLGQREGPQKRATASAGEQQDKAENERPAQEIHNKSALAASDHLSNDTPEIDRMNHSQKAPRESTGQAAARIPTSNKAVTTESAGRQVDIGVAAHTVQAETKRITELVEASSAVVAPAPEVDSAPAPKSDVVTIEPEVSDVPQTASVARAPYLEPLEPPEVVVPPVEPLAATEGTVAVDKLKAMQDITEIPELEARTDPDPGIKPGDTADLFAVELSFGTEVLDEPSDDSAANVRMGQLALARFSLETALEFDPTTQGADDLVGIEQEDRLKALVEAEDGSTIIMDSIAEERALGHEPELEAVGAEIESAAVERRINIAKILTDLSDEMPALKPEVREAITEPIDAILDTINHAPADSDEEEAATPEDTHQVLAAELKQLLEQEEVDISEGELALLADRLLAYEDEEQSTEEFTVDFIPAQPLRTEIEEPEVPEPILLDDDDFSATHEEDALTPSDAYSGAAPASQEVVVAPPLAAMESDQANSLTPPEIVKVFKRLDEKIKLADPEVTAETVQPVEEALQNIASARTDMEATPEALETAEEQLVEALQDWFEDIGFVIGEDEVKSFAHYLVRPEVLSYLTQESDLRFTQLFSGIGTHEGRRLALKTLKKPKLPLPKLGRIMLLFYAAKTASYDQELLAA